MARRDERILDLLIAAPWWVSVALSATTFILLRYVAPAFIPAGSVNSSTYALKGILGGVRSVAPLVALVFLFPAPVAAIRQWRERRLLDTQNDLTSIRALPWRRFETLVAEAYRRQGYAVHGNSGDGPDGGVDLMLKKGGNLVLVQCKQWKALKVGVKVVREMYGVMTAKHAHGAIVITSGFFTQEAKSFAAGKPIDLVEGQQLAELIRSVQSTPAPTSPAAPPPSSTAPKAASAQARQSTATPSATPKMICPKCGATMVLGTAQKGPSVGQHFWGCSRFPACPATEPFENGASTGRTRT